MTDHPRTTDGRVAALAALAYRRVHKPTPVDNEVLPAGAPMYFYCVGCGHLADIKPEASLDKPRRLCGECQALLDLGWLE